MKKWLGKLFSTALPIIIAFILFPYIKDWYMTPSVAGGDSSKEFTATILGGKELQLSDLRGQYVLLHFWGSWCGPCRGQNQQLVPLMRRLEGKIAPVSIAIERDSNRWLAAIRKDDLYWPNQIMDATNSLKFLNGPISNLYGVNQVPTDILLDPAGRVVAINPSFQSIIEAVQ